MSKLNVDQKTIKDLFQDKKADFLIPDYQRPYAWGETECQTLWDDIFSFAIPDEGRVEFDSNSEYFLGPIVTFRNTNFKMEVIDGQQRLTTLMLLLRAFYTKFGHITYNLLDEHYDTDIFTEPTIKGKLGTNAMKAQRHLYDHIVYDSTNERDFATDLDTNTDVAVYVKLPDSFYIATPVGHYNPDWAIAFYEGSVKHIYFVAETKGTLDSMHFNHITPVEQAKIDCARVHFKAISDGNVVYDVVDSYQTLLEKVMK